MELPVTGSEWRASMAMNPVSNAATAGGTSASVIGRNVTIGTRYRPYAEGRKAGRRRSYAVMSDS